MPKSTFHYLAAIASAFTPVPRKFGSHSLVTLQPAWTVVEMELAEYIKLQPFQNNNNNTYIALCIYSCDLRNDK